MSSLHIWQGEFGTQYHQRQPDTDPKPTLEQLLPDGLRSVLEVGCGTGRNVHAIRRSSLEDGTPTRFAWGVEPNKDAIPDGYGFIVGHAGELPFADGIFDLVFTAGVLIHIDPYHLDRAMYEIHRVSRRYILSVEYEHWAEVGVEYRGVPDGIWKRDYWAEWQSLYPGLNLVRYWPAVDFDGTAFEGCSAWLMDKRPTVSGP